MAAHNWSSSDRRSRLPADWARRRQLARDRAGGRCESRDQRGTRCANRGTDCDHVRPGDDHSLRNLQWLCRACHKQKTGREAAVARRKAAARARYPRERHPGL